MKRNLRAPNQFVNVWLAALSGLFLIVSILWEPLFGHTHESELQLLGLFTICLWCLISRTMAGEGRRSAERIYFALFVAAISLMALFPQLVRPGTAIEAHYRGTLRWSGWTIDPNNSGVALAIAAVAALRLREELPERFKLLLLVLASLAILQLVRSFSRIGELAFAIALISWCGPKWRRLEKKRRQCIALAVLSACMMAVFAAPLLRSIDWLLVRRLASFSNTMDLSWANRLYVLPGAIEAAISRPLTGWGWGNVLALHHQVYAPTFLSDSTALLLNDYAHLAASYGIPRVALVIFTVGWCAVCGRCRYAQMTVACLAVAMFFQGVVRIPLTFIPLCVSIGLILGDTPPWARDSWKQCTFSFVPSVCLLAFLAAWCLGPFLFTNKRVRAEKDIMVVSPRHKAPLTVAFIAEDRLEAYGPEARAAASLGVQAVIASPRVINDLDQRYGTNTWVVTASPGFRHISPEQINASTGFQRGVKAVHMAFDASGLQGTPQPDKPYPLRLVVLTLYACAVLLLVRECLSLVSACAANGLAMLCSVVVFLIGLNTQTAESENREIADWARQMHRTSVPEDVYEQYVVDPDIAPAFSLRSRRELWHTFYQTCTGEDALQIADRLKRAIEIQLLIYPDSSPTVRTFEEIWKTRSCNLTERWYFLAAALRTLNVPARVREGKAQVWVDGNWIPAGR